MGVYYLGENSFWPRKKGTSSLKSDAALSKSKRRKKTDRVFENQEVQAIGGKDVSLFLFRALGKILYCKSKKILCFIKNLLGIRPTTEIKYQFLKMSCIWQLGPGLTLFGKA